MTFMWSNCAVPEITVKLDLLSHLSGQLASCVMQTLHQFCYLSILWWFENKPKYALCKRRILSVLKLLQLDDDCLEHVTTPPTTEVICQVGVALGHPGPPSSWSITKVGFKECSGVLWVACSFHACWTTFRTMQCSSRHCNPGSVRRWRYLATCWKSHGGGYHHNHSNQTQGGCRAAGLDVGGVPPKLHSDMHTAACLCHSAMQQQKGHLLHCCWWGSWQPPLSSHCHSTEQEDRSDQAVPRVATSRWCNKSSPSQQLLKRRGRDSQNLSSKQEPSTTSVMLEGDLKHG